MNPCEDAGIGPAEITPWFEAGLLKQRLEAMIVYDDDTKRGELTNHEPTSVTESPKSNFTCRIE